MSKLDPYATLGVSKDASPDQVRKAYRKKAKATHPDAGGNREDFEAVNTANVILSDPVRRARYDATGEIDDKAEDTIEAQAMSKIAAILDEVLAADIDPTTLNLVVYITERISDAGKKLELTMIPLRRAIARARRVETKFKRKSKGDNVLGRLVANRRRQMEQIMASGEREQQVLAAAKKLAAEYTFDMDPPVPASFGTVVGGGVGSLADYLRADIADAINAHHKARSGR